MPPPSKLIHLKIQMLLTRGLLDDAISLAESLLEQHPQDFDITAALANLYGKTAQFSLAKALIESLQPVSLEQKKRLLLVTGDVALAQYNLQDAENAFVALSSLEEQDTSAQIRNLTRVITTNLMKGDISRADYFRQLVDKHTKNDIRDETLRFQLSLLGEYLKISSTAERLNEIQATSLSQQFELQHRMIENAPYVFPACLPFLTNARRLGIWDVETPHSLFVTEHVIPRKIIQFWDTTLVPDDVRMTMESWKQHCIDFSYQLFDDASAESFIRSSSAPEIIKAFKIASQPTMRSDIFRMAYLYEHGGVYVDADDLCRRDLGALLEAGYSLVLSQEAIGSIGNNFIAVARRHPFIKHVLDALTDRVLGRPGENIWFVTGPGAVSNMFCGFFYEDLLKRKSPTGVRIRDIYQLARYITFHVRHRYRYKGTDHWLSSQKFKSPLFQTQN